MYNLGTGKGTSVLEMVAAFEKASGKVLLSCRGSIRVCALILVEFLLHAVLLSPILSVLPLVFHLIYLGCICAIYIIVDHH